MSSETTGDMALIQDEDTLRKMWQETDDFGKKKEIRSHMYKVREARLKDFYNAGEETTTSAESKQHSTIRTSHHSSTTGLKGSNLTTHADSLADHSFLSLKSKEIRDSESPTKDSYKIIETRKINDRDWNVVESNEASKDGKTHSTSRIATTSGSQDLDGGEMKYAAKSEQKASVFKDGDDKNFTKSVQAASQNVIKQEASGGDENSKFYSSSTTTTSSSKFSSEQRSSADDVQNYGSVKSIPTKDVGNRIERFTYDVPGSESETKTVIRKVYTENIPNELKNHPSYVDGNTKVTTETRTLPDGSTVTTTRYETKGATQYSTTSSKTSSTKHISSSNEQKTSSDNIVKSHVISHDDLDDTRSTRSNSISSERADRTIKNRSIDSSRKETHHQESDIKRIHDLELLGRDSKDAKNIEIIIKKQNIPQDESRTVTTTTVTKTIHSDYNDQTIPDNQDSKTTVITTKSYRIPAEDTVTKSSFTTTKKINSNYDKQQVASTDFLDTERRHVTQTKTTTTRIEDDQKIPLPTRKEITETETVNRKEITVPSTPKTEPTFVVKKEFPSEPCKKPPETIEIEIVPIRTPLVKEEPKYDQPERRQPIKPGKSELDERPTPTEGQYDTTYRTDYVPRRISVEVSPTHDAFARSLRSISPDRISKIGSVRSLRTTSTTSLRSTSSPDRHPGKPNKAAPVDSRPTSPTKKVTKTPEKYPTYNPEIVIKKRPESPEKKTQRTITKQAEDRHTDTLTKKKKTTSTTSISTTITETRNEVDSSTLTRKTRPVERPRSRSASPTSIASDIEFVRHRTDLVTDLDTDEITNTKLLRRHTEEFDKQPLGDGAPNKKPQKITDKSATLPLLKKSPSKEPEDSSVDKPKSKTIRRTDTYEERCKEILGISNNKDTPSESSPTTGDEPSRRPQKPSETIITVITKDIKSTHKFPQKKEPNQEVPSETKRSPQKQPLEPYREKPRDIKKAPTVQEFPSQTRRSSEKEPLKPYPEKPKESKKQPSVQEFPSQIRKSPQKEPLEPYPEKPKDNKKGSSVQEFLSQTRRSPQKEPLDSYPEKPRVSKKEPLVKEFPSQTRRSPQKEPLEAYPEKPKNEKKAPTVQEFPSQTRRSPQKEPLEPYPERPKESKRTSLVQEFPSQTRSSEKEPLEPYPVKPKDSKKEPSVQEFPSEIRRSPKKEPLEPFLEKPKDNEKGPSIQEFPSQKRPSSQKEPFEPYPEKPKDIKKEPCVQEFPSQIRFPQEEFLEAHPKEPKDDKKTPNVRDFPFQTGRYPQKEPLEPYSGKPKEGEKTPLIEELPCQTRRIPQKEPLEPYPEKPKGDKKSPTVQEFPSQIRKSPQKEPLEAYPEKPKDGKKAPSVQEFPSQIRTSPQKEVLERYPEKPKDDARKIPSKIQEFPSRVKKPSDISLPTKKGSLSTHETPEQTLEPSDDYPDEYDSDLDEPLQRAPSKVSLDDIPTIKTEKVSLDDLPKVTTKRKSIKETPGKVSLDDLRPKPKPQKVVDNFITNEKVDTEITLKKYKDDSIHKPKGIPDVTSTTDSKTTTKKSKVVKKTKKIISGTAEDEMESSTTEDEEQEDVEEIEDQIVEDIEILDVQRTDKRTKTTTRIEEVDERKLPRKPSERPSSKKPADIDDLESQIIDDETNEFTTVTTTTTEEVQQRKGPTKEDTIKTKKQPITGTKSPDKTKPKSKSHEPHIEDFITVTRTQLLQTESKVPIEEPVHVKKFITTLCEDEEQDRMTQEQITLVQKERKIKTMPTEEKMPKPTSVVKKDQPEKARFTPKKTPEKKKPDEAFIRKEKLDTIVTSKIDSRRTISKRPVDDRPSKQSGRKIPDDQKVIKTEYMEQFTVKTKPKTTSLTPVKQPSRKPSPKGVPTVTDTTLHFKVQKVDSTTTRKGINVLKVTQVDKKPIAPKTPSKKRPDDQQPKQPAKLKVPEIKQPRTTSPSIKTTTTVQKTVEVRPPKRHVVSTIINIKPKQKPETITNTIHKTTVTKTILAPKTSKITTKPLKQKPKPIVNGHVSTDEEDSDIENVENVIPRGVSKVPRDHATPTRSSPLNTTERKKKCITTKSILIENAVADQREIIVDLKRSKSSREGTPDRICPYPISADSDQGIPRYPDRIIEPEDGGQRPKRISDIPLMETEDVHDFNRITEIAEDRRRTTKTQVDTTDECLLSVNEKVNKFLSTAEQITNKPLDGKPAPKVERPRLDIDESLKEDECLLSVSDKVSRFIATAEQLASSTTRETIQRPKSPRPRDPKPHQPEDTPQTKDYEVSRATKTTEVRKSISPERKPQTIERKSPDHPARSPDRKLQSYTLERMSPERKRELDTSKAKSPERKPISDSPKSKTPERKPETDTTRYKTPERKSDTYSRKTTEEIVKIRKQSFEDETTPKSSRRLSKDEPKTVLSPTGRLRSTETIKKAKALFENIGKEQDIVRQKDILNRPSIFEGRKLTQTEEKFEKVDERKVKDVRTKLTYDEVRTTPSPDKQPQPKAKVPRDHSPDQEVPHYMTPLDRTVKEHRPQKENPDEYDLETLESDRSRGTTPDKHVPHYMLPLDRSLRERSPHKENVKQLEDIMNRSNISTYSDETEIKNTKFGVTLRRTDSGRVVTVHKKLSTSSVDDTFVKELDIEEIWELEYLEKLLETVVGYDIRRRIRAQIRVIKRATEEGTLETLIKARRRSPRKESPIRQMRSPDKDDISQVRRYSSTDKRKQTEEYVSHHASMEVSEYQSSYKRKTSSEYSSKTKSPSISPTRDPRESSPKKEKSTSPERKGRLVEGDATDTKTTTTTTTTKIFQTDLKKSKPTTKTVVEEKPEWITQRTLRKVSETTVPVKKTVTTTTTTQKLVTKKDGEQIKQPTDVITSSYGVGPTDENGTPLFGLKALRAQNKSEKTKVQGTVIRSQYYSENGAEPTGEISVTKFSSDPKDLEEENIIRKKGIASVTTTQKFGYKGTPSLKTITGKTEKTTDENVECKTSSLKTSKITRRGSVKEISQKFIENAVDTLKSERQPSYPKAGLILRTSSFKDSPINGTGSGGSREGSPATQDVQEETVTTVETRKRSATSGVKKADTFLSNRSKVTGVQDVLSRMRNEAEIEDDETLEDAEAKNLLNKFIGSQVLLSEMESHSSKLPVSVSPDNVKRTTKITTTTTSLESSKPTTVTRTFTHPITTELLENIWDEQTLKLLLEQSTDYEDRRIIRARLREIMAEQEACAELVKQASEDASSTKEAGSAQVHDGAGPVDETDSEEETEDEEDDDQATVKTALQQEIKSSPTQQQPQPDLIMQTNPIYNKPSEERDTTNNNSENDEYPSQLNEKANRFNSKKLKMKRANTIDIPKPLKYYECDEDDSDNEDFNNRRHSYLALRGPIRVGKLNVEKKVPEFEPKTESDKKFMAFLGKHTENAPNTNRTTLWCNQQPMNKGFAGSNWSNKFGNVKNNFEKMQTGNSVNSARNFWKSADDAVVARRAPQFGPKISRQSAKNLQQMFEEKHKQTQQAQQTQPQRSANQTIENVNQNNNIVTGTLKVDTSKTNKNVAVVVTQPNSINKFSHAPMSAFKPVTKKIEIPYPMQQLNPPQQSSYLKPKPLKITPDINSNFQSAENNKISSKIPDSPLYLYSPKQVSPENASPTNSTPWNSTRASGESRVLSIAATKFQNMTQERDPLPRRMSKEKIVIPPSLINQQKQPQEKLTAPYLVRSVAQGNSVRKLSGQYDNMGNKDIYHDSRTQYGTKAALSSDNRQHNVKPILYDDQKQQNDQKVSPNYDNKQQNGVRTSTLYSDDSRQFSDNLQQYYSQAALSGDSRDNSNRQQYNVTAVLPSENRQEYSASDKQHCGQYSDTYINLSSDKVEQYDIQPRTFVPGENYTIQYDHPVPVPPQPKVYNAEYIVSQQQYNVPSDYLENARDKEDPYDTAVYHNQQQQIISQIKQTSPNLRQPEVYQETPKYEEENNQYISSYQFKPQAQIPNFKSTENKVQDNRFSYTADIRNEAEREEVEKVFPNETKSPYNPRQNFTYERQTSQESIKEYTAVSSKVMSGPVSQQAVTVQQNAPKSRDQHDMEYNLKATLQKLSSQTEFSQREQQKASVKAPLERKSSLKQGSDPPAMVLYNNVKQRPSLCINDKPLSLESLETNERGEQVLTSKFHIPLKQIQSKSLSAASSASRELSKSESWHQICQSSQQTPSKPSPRGSPNSRSVLRSKSSHSLAVPKQFEAGMSKTEMLEKKRTMEAYFGVSPKAESKKSSSSINRVKTSQKISTQRQNSGGSGGGLCRSKTLPDILCLDKLDDSNIDAIFEDLFNARTTKTTTYTEGPVTTTTQVTTRVTTQEQMKKPMSPFAKFRQLDKQNSLNSPPSTPKSPTTGSPLFKFTDASLNQSANTVKQRLLQWCQMKTKEYENIQLDNFSTSWSDGMAFCALIHHFLPDAFDYNTLNPKNRRHNFTLAFRVADEKAGIAPLLDVDDMVAISRPDWKCVFTYVQSIYRRFKDED